MVQKLDEYIEDCLSRSVIAEKRSAAATDVLLAANFRELAAVWRHLAQSYESVKRVDRSITDAAFKKAQLEKNEKP